MQRKLNEFAPPEQSIQPAQQTLIPPGETDHEGEMARADLVKLATYSEKLYKKIDNNAQLESWVQAKITKAADYITSVYHYLEYEMPLSDYGKQLDNAEVYSESQRAAIKNKLIEAKEVLKTLKIAQADKLAEAKSSKAKKDYDQDGEIESEKDEVIGSRRKAAGLDKSKKDVELNELSTDTMKSYAKSATQDLTDKATKLARTDSSKKQSDLTRKVVNRNKGIATAIDKMEEDSEQDDATSTAKYDKLGLPVAESSNLDESKQSVNFDEVDLSNLTRIRDLDELKSAAFELISKPSKRPMKPEKVEWFKNVLDQKTNTASVIKMMYDLFLSGEGYGVIGSKGSTKQSSYRNKFNEADAKPSAGLSKEKKSAVVKKAVAGKDIGKPGKGFEKVADKAAKKYGSKEKGAKVAAAAMWKNIKKESMNEGMFDFAENPMMADLLKLQQQYQGTQWESQIEKRIDDLKNQIELGHAPQTATGEPIPVLPPEEWAKQNPGQINESVELSRIRMLSGL